MPRKIRETVEMIFKEAPIDSSTAKEFDGTVEAAVIRKIGMSFEKLQKMGSFASARDFDGAIQVLEDYLNSINSMDDIDTQVHGHYLKSQGADLPWELAIYAAQFLKAEVDRYHWYDPFSEGPEILERRGQPTPLLPNPLQLGLARCQVFIATVSYMLEIAYYSLHDSAHCCSSTTTPSCSFSNMRSQLRSLRVKELGLRGTQIGALLAEDEIGLRVQKGLASELQLKLIELSLGVFIRDLKERVVRQLLLLRSGSDTGSMAAFEDESPRPLWFRFFVKLRGESVEARVWRYLQEMD
ncbi:hypothetical protein BJ508DRAFT_361888 [Ascobolus immersus RN42]|uniref:Uncharacterized protein n=1 Tax=Ascobolus immersus RN42 TaxID=1160509 RepID=A0A3N4I9F4_ASCIM|nr:hypothetical protein BJ508DRAFT_361888 [Ascobolus immersus RN42]